MSKGRDSALTPIYDSLVEERGDVPAEARTAAEEFTRSAAEALNWRAAVDGPIFRSTLRGRKS